MLETLFGQRLTAGKNSMRIIINRALLMRTMMRVYSEDVVMMRMTNRVSHFGVIFPNHSASGRDLCASH